MYGVLQDNSILIEDLLETPHSVQISTKLDGVIACCNLLEPATTEKPWLDDLTYLKNALNGSDRAEEEKPLETDELEKLAEDEAEKLAEDDSEDDDLAEDEAEDEDLAEEEAEGEEQIEKPKKDGRKLSEDLLQF